MKKFALLLAACFCFINGFAAYLRDVPVTVTQPDGTVLHCLASGDEYFNYLHDKDGYTIMQHPKTGYYVYAEKRDEKLVATNIVAGKYNPASKGLQPYALISPEEWIQRRKAWEVEDPRPKNRDGQPNHGTLNNIAIFIRFSDDTEFTNTFSSIDNMFNDMNGSYGTSMRSYFQAASYGAIDIPTTFYPGHNDETIISYQDTCPRSYFQPYNSSTNTNGYQDDDERRQREFDLLERAVNYVTGNNMIPTDLNIDYDNDNYVDNVCFIVRGNVGAWSSLLWPHKWSLYDREVLINGKCVYTFNFQLADATDHFKTSTMCHEMNHSLGAPDLYHYYNGKNLKPVGNWDLMENNATPPQHCGAYMKMKYGHWIDEIPEITQAGTYTLNPISSTTPNNIAYKISTDDPNQFYVLEYRNNSIETALYGSGLLIYRIDTRFDGNADYDPNNGIYDEVYIYRPNGTTSNNGTINNAYFSSAAGRTQFSTSTNPQPFFTDGSLNNSLRIYDITTAGNTISFTYGSMASCLPPVIISSIAQDRNAVLTWDAANNAQSYRIYRDGVLISTTESTTFTDEDLSYGVYSYYVKSVDADNRVSTASSTILINIYPLASNLTVEVCNNDAVLSWDKAPWYAPTSPLATLSYGEDNKHYSWTSVYYAHRYLASDLAQYAGKAVYKVSTYVKYAGTYSTYVYTASTSNDKPDANSLAMQKEEITVSSPGWFDFDADDPIILSGENDLWVVMKQENTGQEYPTPSFDLNEHNINAFYSSSSSPTNLYDANSNYNCAWFIKAYLTDGTYTYNIYDGETKLNEEAISDTTYMHEDPATNTIHNYTVKTNYYGGESDASNTASLALGSNTLASLTLENNDNMTIGSGSTLTITGTGTLTNTDPANLVLEDSAQLIHNSDGVAATVKKNIAAWTTDPVGGWYFIASPINSNELAPNSVANMLTDANEENGPRTYDLYSYDANAQKPWVNYRKHIDDGFVMANGAGYLYANAAAQTLEFSGELKPYNTSTNTVTLTNTGWNLIGNPFTCAVTVNKAFSELNNGSSVTNKPVGSIINPCAGIAVYGNANEAVTFTAVEPQESTSNPSNLSITLTQQVVTRDGSHNATIDNAVVSFNENDGLPKFPLLEANSKLYIPKDNEEYAIVNANAHGEMPVNFIARENGSYTLTVNPENVEMNYLHLIDNMTGANIDLLQTPSYSFEARVSDYESRFKLVFSSACKDADDDNEDFAFINDGNIIIYKEGTLQIVDMMGRVVYQGDAMNRVSTSGMTSGVYVLRLIDGENVKTQKIVIE